MFLSVLGVMTGNSCDGLDASCIEIGPEGWKSLWNQSVAYPSPLKKRVLALQVPVSKHSLKTWLELHRDLGEWYGRTLNKIIQFHSKPPDLIANHGQTVGHFPQSGSNGMTLQLGDPTRISAHTRLTVVGHFREGDMAVGGQGAPLVPIFHRMIAHRLKKDGFGIAIHNLGGISNLTYLGPEQEVLAFDTGPGNVWIDAAVAKMTCGKRQFDKNGKIAASSQPHERSVQKILLHPFFSKKPPKSTGRDEFPFQYFLSKTRSTQESMVATATEVTIRSIVHAYQTWILGKGLNLQEILLCGGGAKNLTILHEIQKRLPEVVVSSLSRFGFDSQYTEAQAFAIFGFLSLMGHPLGGSWTGAHRFGPPGHLIPGENWNSLMTKSQLFFQDPTSTQRILSLA
jgi:anhydro-N-acetylmuramic acid kinase